ncbi:hypothetical protein PhiBTCVTUL1a_21 [Burkholderia phage phiBtTUL1a]|nr:hypothetical protein PhiBTCVTUL1a_21 [Burkholderia phage phiBtTUL1a]
MSQYPIQRSTDRCATAPADRSLRVPAHRDPLSGSNRSAQRCSRETG